MIAATSPFTSKNARATAVLAALLLAACAPQYSPPQQVAATNPSVTYKYRGDQELLQANQTAQTYCNQYRSVAQTSNITNGSDGSKTVVFQCVAMAPGVVPAQPFNPNLAYNYRTDQDLLDASRNAEVYCMNNGSQRAVSTAITNTDGTKTVRFQCTQG